jgi:hypothetical protein
LLLAAALAGTTATPAFADYGTGAQYQIEISANNVGGVPGDGVWLWIELNRNGTGDYTGADCIHTGPAGLNGAGHQRGDVTWTDSGDKLTITGVAPGGCPVPGHRRSAGPLRPLHRGIGQLHPELRPRLDRRDSASAGRPVKNGGRDNTQRHPLPPGVAVATVFTRAEFGQ